MRYFAVILDDETTEGKNNKRNELRGKGHNVRKVAKPDKFKNNPHVAEANYDEDKDDMFLFIAPPEEDKGNNNNNNNGNNGNTPNSKT